VRGAVAIAITACFPVLVTFAVLLGRAISYEHEGRDGSGFAASAAVAAAVFGFLVFTAIRLAVEIG